MSAHMLCCEIETIQLWTISLIANSFMIILDFDSIYIPLVCFWNGLDLRNAKQLKFLLQAFDCWHRGFTFDGLCVPLTYYH